MALALFAVTTVRSSVRLPLRLKRPPPLANAVPVSLVALTLLWLMRLSRTTVLSCTWIPPPSVSARKPEDAGTIASAVLFSTLLSVRSSEPSESMPPASAAMSPAVLLPRTLLPLIRELRMIVVDPGVR